MIFIEPYLGSEGTIFDCLLKISGCDPGLTAQVATTMQKVFYFQKIATTFSSGRLLEIVNSPKQVVIHGVDDSFPTPWGPPMIEYGGATDVDLTASTFRSDIYVDVTEAGGYGYRSMDNSGNYIYAALTIILFHELAHAYHGMIVDDTPGDEYRDQMLAINDENQFRRQLGWPQRNPNITFHEFVGPPTSGPTSLKMCNEHRFPDLCKCNIATAVLGSPVARQIVEFRRAKREFESLTVGGVPILAPMWNAYQMFSPAVAGRLLADPQLRGYMLRYGVQPAVYLLRMVRAYLDGEPVGRMVDDYLDELAEPSYDDLIAAADGAVQADSAMRSGVTVPPPALGRSPGDVFGEVAYSARTRGVDNVGPAWVLDGLAMLLRAAAERLDGGRPDPDRDLGGWLARVPLPALGDEVSASELSGELARIAHRLSRREQLRREVEVRLAAASPVCAELIGVGG